MDPAMKKRKADENGTVASDGISATKVSTEDTRKIIEPFTQEQLLDILQDAVSRHADVLDAVRLIADRDPTQRKLFIRGLGWETTTEGLRTLFSSYGDLDEAVVILDKVTGKSKGYGFVTFKHIDGAMLALKEPSKKIDGRMTVTQLAASGTTGPTSNIQPIDVSARKIYVGNVPFDMPSDRLLAHFSSYGEIEEGPLGFDKQTGKSRGFALFVYKNSEAARASLVDPIKTIDGHQLVCKLAIEGKKGKPGAPNAVGVQGQSGVPGEVPGDGLQQQSSMPSGMSSYGGGFGGGHQVPAGLGHHHPHHHMGGQGLSSMGSQVPPLGGSGYGAGLGGGFGSGPVSGGYGGPNVSGYGGLSGGAGSMYRLPPGSVGMPSGGYPESGHYGLTSSAFPGQHHQPSASSPVPRVPPLYHNLPPYY
ncbi:hypothetical protein MKX01_038554 [Papaver californicum]|nr:hypothetical protein MKX01_038554 [Papaver californicum]